MALHTTMNSDRSMLNSSSLARNESKIVFFSGLISGDLYWRLMSIVLILDVIMAAFATVANIITIRVYYRMGYKATTNISLTALAVSDLGVAITTFSCVLAILLPTLPNAPFTYEIFMTSGPAPHVAFARVSALITTYISVERYLCVSLPLKIKSIITPGRTLVAMVIMFVAAFVFYPILFLRYPVGWVFVPYLNRTMLGILPVTDEILDTVFLVSQTYTSLVLPIFTFTTVLLTTILLSLSLMKSKRWRDANKSISSNPSTTAKAVTVAVNNKEGGDTLQTPESSSSKETRAVKMVIAITTVFIISSIPSSIHMVVVLLVPEFELGRRYSNMFALTGMMFLVVDAINCSANVIIYYSMSSKFRHAMQGLCCGNSKET